MSKPTTLILVSNSGAIMKNEFEFNGFTYKVISSESKGRIWNTIDTIRRNDGVRRKFTRKELKEYFKEIV